MKLIIEATTQEDIAKVLALFGQCAPAQVAAGVEPSIAREDAEAKEKAGRKKNKGAAHPATPGEGGANNVASGTGLLSTTSVAESPSDESAVQTTPAAKEAISPSEPAGEDVKSYTIDDVRNALSGLNSAKGLPAAKEALAAFGANRVSDVKEDQYAAFIAHCGKAAA